jgi:hypothetical protein
MSGTDESMFPYSRYEGGGGGDSQFAAGSCFSVGMARNGSLTPLSCFPFTLPSSRKFVLSHSNRDIHSMPKSNGKSGESRLREIAARRIDGGKYVSIFSSTRL